MAVGGGGAEYTQSVLLLRDRVLMDVLWEGGALCPDMNIRYFLL